MSDSPFTRRSKLKAITIKIGSGATPRGGKNSYKAQGVALIRSLNVYDFEFSLEGLAYIDEDQAEELANVEVQPNDILLNITGASVARCCMVPYEVLPARVNQHVAIVRVNQELANAYYVMYCLNSPTYKNHLLTLAQGGATREALTKTTIEEFEIPYPPLETQRRIAAVLSAYDDLIENNTQRIKALEAAAQALYREWFVEFRFPGHESVEWVESELGRIPAGWEVTTVGDAYEIVGGGTPSTNNPEYWENGTINWYSPSDLTAASSMFVDESSKKITELGLRKSSARLFPSFSVMMTSRATLGVVSINTTEACTNQGFITCIPNNRISAYYLYFWIQEHLEIINNLASGATFKEITKTNFRTIQFSIPDRDVHDSFLGTIEPIGRQILNLQRRNVLLREARDLLLPRLISGELSAENIEVR